MCEDRRLSAYTRKTPNGSSPRKTCHIWNVGALKPLEEIKKRTFLLVHSPPPSDASRSRRLGAQARLTNGLGRRSEDPQKQGQLHSCESPSRIWIASREGCRVFVQCTQQE